jgi:putative holliday junction resolvase
MRLQATRAVRPPESGSQAGAVLAIDYGRRRIGLAISDEMRWTAAPLATMERKGRASDLLRLREIAARHQVALILVGYPLRMDGTAGELAAEAGRFARRVEQALGIPVELVDERLTSWAARRWRAEHGKAARQRSDDEIAAAILLEEFLGRERRSEG